MTLPVILPLILAKAVDLPEDGAACNGVVFVVVVFGVVVVVEAPTVELGQ